MRRAILAFILVLMSGAAFAQDTVPKIKGSALDTSVPESPAFTVLGVTPSTITHPTSPRGLASSLLNGVDQSGHLQTGVAIDTAPYLLFYGNNVTLTDYQGSRMVRVLSRTAVSVGTTKGGSDADKSVKLALGVTVTIFDKGDARESTDYLKDLAAAADNALKAAPPLSPLADEATTNAWKALNVARVEAATKAMRAEWEKKRWNKSSWIVAAAQGWSSEDGTFSGLGTNGGAVWSSLSYGFESVPGLKDNAQVVIHGRFHTNEDVADPENTGKFYRQKSVVAGASVRVGTPKTIGSFEAAYVHVRPVDRPTDQYLRLTLAAEERLADNVWLHFSVGGESGKQNGQDKLFVLGSFKWAIGPKE